MERTSRKKMDLVLLRLESALGTPRKLELDNMNPGDGRTYLVLDSKGTAPLGHGRRTAKDMLATMYAVVEALEYKERKFF